MKSLLLNKSLITILGIVAISANMMLLSGCENADYAKCKDNASKLWNNQQGGDPHKNDAYWAAVAKCKEKYDQ